MRKSGDRPQVAHAFMRGIVAAMAMSGMRTLTTAAGLVDQTPPEAIAKQRGPDALQRVPKKQRQAVVELLHWAVGGAGGGVFGALPQGIRRARWAGPAYGLVLWLSFEAGIAPMLGLRQSKETRLAERLALAADHLLYGLVLNELHTRPQP